MKKDKSPRIIAAYKGGKKLDLHPRSLADLRGMMLRAARGEKPDPTDDKGLTVASERIRSD